MIPGIVAGYPVASVPPVPGWPSMASVSSLLYFNGTDGSTTFTDEKGSAWTGTNAEIDTAQSVFGGSSALFNGSTTSRVQTTGTPAIADLIGHDFTVAAFIRPIVQDCRIFSTGGSSIVWNGSNGIHMLLVDIGGVLVFSIATGGGAPLSFSSTLAIPLASWSFVTASFDASTGIAYLSINGVVQASPPLVGINRPTDAPRAAWGKIVGGNDGDTMNGHIDHGLICKGLCFYTSDFTVPTSPLT